MAIKQLSIFIENKQGKLSQTVKLISEAKINIRALSIADTTDFGILRMIVSDVDKAKEILSKEVAVNTTDVLAVKMDDVEGALYKILQVLEAGKIDVEYSYAFASYTAKGAYVVFRVDDVKTAEKLLTDNGFSVISDSDI